MSYLIHFANPDVTDDDASTDRDPIIPQPAD